MSHIGMFFCWLRGYHVSSYEVTEFDNPNVYGIAAPCNWCGTRPLIGSIAGAYLTVTWKHHGGPSGGS